jgi:hypothetical protein
MKNILIPRRDGHTYLMNVIFISILTVICTRIFLQLSNYPQIGGNGLHIAHMLWGGLLMLVAIVLLYLYKGKVTKNISTIFAGIGWGLFIDELGKFITANNDYHFKAAAPLIYVIFLLIILVFIQAQKKKRYDSKVKFFEVLEDLEEIVRGDFDEEEKKTMEKSLKEIISDNLATELHDAAEHILQYVQRQKITGSKDGDILLSYKVGRKLKDFLDKLIPRKLFIRGVSIVLILRIILSIPIIFLIIFPHGEFLATSMESIFFAIITGIQVIFSIYFCISLEKFLKGSRASIKYSVRLLIFSILVLDVFLFYYTQFLTFSTIMNDFVLYVIFSSLKNLPDQKEVATT